jgi:hypothetical protein
VERGHRGQQPSAVAPADANRVVEQPPACVAHDDDAATALAPRVDDRVVDHLRQARHHTRRPERDGAAVVARRAHEPVARRGHLLDDDHAPVG